MKRLGWIAFGCICFQLASAQTVSLKDITGLLELTPGKLENHLQKKGYRRSGFFEGKQAPFSKKGNKNSSSHQRFYVNASGQGLELVYETDSEKEFAGLVEQMKASSFSYPVQTGDVLPILYQKEELLIYCASELEDTSLVYVIKASKKSMPRMREIVFAEDLLTLDSHEFLAAAFGKGNVKEDWFYFTAENRKKCSVIFPNTSRQAIFIWEDEDNRREISFILIGEQMGNEKGNQTAVMLSDWRSNQGVYCGMSLKEVQNLNNEPVSFYNWRTETAGFLAPDNKGQLDFERVKPVFSCMNCSFLHIDDTIDIIESGYAIDENQKVYVGSFVVLPEKKAEFLRQTLSMKRH